MDNVEQLQQLARAFQGSRILLTSFELGIFTVIGDGSKDSLTISNEINADHRATDRLLNALCSLKLLIKKDGFYSNSPLAQQHLVKGKKGYLAGLSHINNMWDSWSRLTGSIIRDEEKSAKAEELKRDSWYESFISAMHSRAKMSAPKVVGQLNLEKVKKVLDVGGGSGIFSVEFAKQNTEIKATVLDLPHVIEMTKQYVAESGLGDSIDYLPGNYNDLGTFGSGYDLVFLCAIIHINSPEKNRQLIQKCADSINPGGRIVISDFVMDEDRTSPPHGTFFALNMLVGTPEGDTYTESELKEWFESAGLTNFERLAPVGPATTVIATKLE